jgi:signal transduction histidine kinase
LTGIYFDIAIFICKQQSKSSNRSIMQKFTHFSNPTIIDQDEIDLLLQEAFDTRVRDIEKAINMVSEALNLSTKVDYQKGIAYSNCYLGYFKMILNENKEALAYALLSNRLFEAIGEKAGMALASFTIGSVHYKTDETHLGLKFLLESLELYRHCEDALGQSRAMKAIGTMYEYLGEYKSAEKTYLKTIELSESINDLNGKSNALNTLTGIYLRKKEINLALETAEESIRLKQQTQDIRGLAFALYVKAKVLAKKKDFKEAEKLYLESLATHEQVNEKIGWMMCLNKLGQLHYRQNNFSKAKNYLDLCIEEGKRIDHFLIMNKAYFTLYKISKKENDHSTALKYLEQHIQSKEKILNKEVGNIIKSMEAISKVEILEKEAKWQKEINKEIENKNAELDKFVYKVSHDLRGPVSSLMGLYNLVEYEITDEASLRYFKIYNEQILRLNNRLLGFIDLIQVRDKKVELREIKFEKIVEECVSSLNYLPNYSKTKFTIIISPKIRFKSDESAINTIIQNLIENGLKYSRSDIIPEIKVQINQTDEILYLEFEDNGEGIKKEDQKKVFDMFYRSSNKTKGTGLGLYLVKHAVEKLSGNFEFESSEGVGTKFKINLPKTEAAHSVLSTTSN